MTVQTKFDRGMVAILAVLIVLAFVLAGCAGPERVVTNTQVIDRPVPVRVKVERPRECLDRYAVDRLPEGAAPDEVNKAILAEIEERAACELKLRAALTGEIK